MHTFIVFRENMKAMRHFQYESALHLAYKTVLPRQFVASDGLSQAGWRRNRRRREPRSANEDGQHI